MFEIKYLRFELIESKNTNKLSRGRLAVNKKQKMIS
ncbi:hypothetical protein Palpr_1844 [Paludibacter propionicigenes WB4]|uniref:Uncharacterized protein n=1 Tax=Paludibacter propionicigenes (strain DSM 17365 / JCM 13257 / WB4) TaxID=694427 RepID=E4T5I9_PALPW|nr:hypothetical protein Palpr_1844 [Paludibacter propionicigenes WB4]